MTKIEEKYRAIDKQMERFNAAPSDLLDSIKLPTYLFYSQKNKHAYCTHCHETFLPFKGLKHNNPTTCPKCGAQAVAKSEGKGHSTPDIVWTLWIQPDGEDVCTHYYRTVCDWSDYEHPEVETTEEFREIHDSEGSRCFMWWYNNQPQYAGRYRWLPYGQRGMAWNSYSSEYYEPRAPYVYGNLAESLKGTRWNYMPIDALLDVEGRNENGTVIGFHVDAWLYEYWQKPALELLVKVGFKRLTRAAAHGSIKLNNEARNVMDALGVTKAQYKVLLGMGDPTEDELKMLLKVGLCSADDVRSLVKFDKEHYRSADNVLKLVKYAPLSSIIKYLEGITDVVSYNDYIGWLESLGYDLHDRYYLFPKNFWKAHDRLMAEHYAAIDQKNNDSIRHIVEQLTNPAFSMHSNGLFIRVAASATELRKEGAALHHCVATYADRMASGKTLILFIRRESDPDAPYYTMELRDGRIVQLRGAHNCSPVEEVVAFRDEFIQMLNRKAAKKAA